MKKKDALELLRKYRENTCSEDEKALLEAWYRQWQGGAFDLRDDELTSVRKQTWEQLATSQKENKKFNYWYLAASIVFALTSVSLFLHFNKMGDEQGRLQQNTTSTYQHDAIPGGNKATLSLGNGTVITLDETDNGEIAKVNGVRVRKTSDGQIVYDVSSDNSSADPEHLPSNMITTPRGGQYQVTLPDGTRVWLNAASSLKYPLRFTGRSRHVELSGEAYFEVSKQLSASGELLPFIVTTDLQTVEVLGTRFNINSYADEATVKTTLLEGAVRVSVTGTIAKHEVVLEPHQQSALSGSDLRVTDVNPEEAVAWKDGYFSFQQADIETVMRQLSRWYALDVVYEGAIPTGTYSGKVYRDMNLSAVLEILSFTQVNFRIEGKTIIIFP